MRKDFDCSHGILKVNVYFEKLLPAAILFRSYDDENYYSLELNGYDYSIRVSKYVYAVPKKLA